MMNVGRGMCTKSVCRRLETVFILVVVVLPDTEECKRSRFFLKMLSQFFMHTINSLFPLVGRCPTYSFVAYYLYCYAEEEMLTEPSLCLGYHHEDEKLELMIGRTA